MNAGFVIFFINNCLINNRLYFFEPCFACIITPFLHLIFIDWPNANIPYYKKIPHDCKVLNVTIGCDLIRIFFHLQVTILDVLHILYQMK